MHKFSFIIASIVISILLMTPISQALSENILGSQVLAQCDASIQQTQREIQATFLDDNSLGLYFTWVSQECEMRAGPEYIIRKYTFFSNGTFYLLRHYYVDSSCSIASHTVITNGFIEPVEESFLSFGMIQMNYNVDSVYIIPLNQQFANKLWRRQNLTCPSEVRWKPYTPQLIYENLESSETSQGPTYNSPQAHSSTKALDEKCLEPFGLEFTELNLLRIEKKLFRSVNNSFYQLHYQLLLANPPPNKQSRWIHDPISLQSTPLIRADMVSDCPICRRVIRGNEINPPVFHQEVDLPALIGGFWHSERCESFEGGIWLKRQFQLYSGDKLWTGRWNFYEDAQCTMFIYGTTAAGSYILRSEKKHKNDEDFYQRDVDTNGLRLKRSLTSNNSTAKKKSLHNFHQNISYNARTLLKINATEDKRQKRSLNAKSDVYELLSSQFSATESRYTAILRGNQPENIIQTKKSLNWPSGTTELDLYVVQNILNSGSMMSFRCTDEVPDVPVFWSETCVPYAINPPFVIQLRARLSVNWNGQYIMKLGSRSTNLWDDPLRQCAQIPPYNEVLQDHLKKNINILKSQSSAAIRTSQIWLFGYSLQILLWCVYYLAR